MPIKTSSAKAKGRRLQNDVRDILFKRYPWLKEGDLDSCSMGSGGVDIKMSPLARKTLGMSIECKATKKTPSLAELRQARANAYEGTLASVVWSPHGSGPDKALIMMDFKEFLDFVDWINDETLADIAWRNREEAREQEKDTENEDD